MRVLNRRYWPHQITCDKVVKYITDRDPRERWCYDNFKSRNWHCLGFNPKTYGHGNYHSAANAQFRDAVQKNNALKYSLQQCVDWFSYIEKSWSIPTFEQGRLVICNDVCGAD